MLKSLLLLLGGTIGRRQDASKFHRATLTDANGEVTADVHFEEPVGFWTALARADEERTRTHQ